MAIGSRQEKARRGFRASMFIIAVGTLIGLGAAPALADHVCEKTATLQYLACRDEVRDDFFTGKAICINLTDDDERAECLDDARAESQEAKGLCRDQRRARRELCDLLGGGAYDPDFDPALFEPDPRNPVTLNPYYPLVVGYEWEYEAEDEGNTVTVLDKTKLIEGVNCLVIRDFVVAEDTQEDTKDWFGLRLDGTVDYCGEEVRDFEIFPGDDPQDPELVETDGSFKEGRDGDRSGTLFPAVPVVGATYRQEWSPGNAEDFATILSTTYHYGEDPDLDQLVPQALADLLCNHDCVVTRDGSALEPDVLERKYYSNGIGVFLETKPEDGEINQLVDCNFDARCAALPAP